MPSSSYRELILSFVFYFITQVVMIDGKSGLEALKASYRFVEATSRLHDSGTGLPGHQRSDALCTRHRPLLGLVSLPYIYAWPHCFTSIAAQTGKVQMRRRARGWRLAEGKSNGEEGRNSCNSQFQPLSLILVPTSLLP